MNITFIFSYFLNSILSRLFKIFSRDFESTSGQYEFSLVSLRDSTCIDYPTGKIIIIFSRIPRTSGVRENFEFYLTKINALSTLRQLGIIIIILIIGYPILSFFHLIIHPLFKVTLFLCAGIIINNFNNNQDIRMIGCLSHQMPLTITIINIENISVCGIPFISRFYSKDLIIEIICIQNCNIFLLILIFIGVRSIYKYMQYL